NESRMFRVQFSGDSHKQALEGCSTCVQMLLQYIDVQNPDGKVQNQALQLSQPTNVSLSGSLELESQGQGLEEGQTEAQSTLLEGRVSIKQLAKSMLGVTSPKLPLAYQQSTLSWVLSCDSVFWIRVSHFYLALLLFPWGLAQEVET
ncbi:hypothetical protein scyTo_0020505, partial [Scyliorhinus torazame]|nr:hypothetical protein [Scyliorhinus torazame]